MINRDKKGGKNTRLTYRIIFLECQKIFRNPLVLLVFLTFLLINIVVVQNAYGSQDDQKLVQRMHRVLQAKEQGKKNSDVEVYNEYKKAYGKLYDNLDMLKIMEMKEKMSRYEPTGKYQKFIENNYKKLQKRTDEIKASGADQADFYPGIVYFVHGTLFGKLGKKLLLEIVVLVFLSVLYLMDYERVQKTEDQVFVTRCGKDTLHLKMIGGILSGLIYSALLLLASYGWFLAKLPLKGLWKVPVSASMMAEPRFGMLNPFVTFWNVNLRSYLLLTLVMFLAIALLAGVLAGAGWYCLKNSYLVFLVLSVLLMGSVQAALVHTTTFLDIVLAICNPGILWITCGAWFMENDLTLSFAGSEFCCLFGCGILILLPYFIGKKRFRKWELK